MASRYTSPSATAQRLASLCLAVLCATAVCAVAGPAVPAEASPGCPRAGYGTHYYAPGPGKTVALTFDDGPGASTGKILSILRGQRVRATFFNDGDTSSARRQLVRQEARMGEALGNHTWDHPDMSALSGAAQAGEIDAATRMQRTITGRGACVFRPPYGSYNSTTLSLAQRRRMKVWLWSVDTEDWKASGSSSAYWVNRIVSLAESQGGSQRHPVVLMHNQPAGNPATAGALPAIIKFFRGHGYTFVRLSRR